MSDTKRYFLNRNEPSCGCWCVVRYLLDFQSIVLAQFSSRAEAEAHLRFLKRARPTASYEVVFTESVATSGLMRSK